MSLAQRFWREEERALGVCAMAAGWGLAGCEGAAFLFFSFLFYLVLVLPSGLVLYSFFCLFLVFFQFVRLCSSFGLFGVFFLSFCSLCSVFFLFIWFIRCFFYLLFTLFFLLFLQLIYLMFFVLFFFSVYLTLPSFLSSIFLIPLFFSIVPCSFFLSSFHLPLSLLSLLTISSPLPFFIILIFFSGFGGYENMGRS